MMVEWQPGQPWTHPSIQRLSLDEMREKLAEAYDRLDADQREFGAGAKELIHLDLERIDTFCLAIENREQVEA